MPRQSEILIGLDVGAMSMEAVAFAADGHQLARATIPIESRQADDAGEQQVSDAWRAATLALRRLAEAVSHLQARTVALAITGSGDGTWLIDRDGDPVGPACLGQDRRVEPVVERWRQRGVAARVRAVTGRALEPSMQSAQLAFLARHRPEVLARAATAFAPKDGVHFFCTGVRATDAATAAMAFGDWRTGVYDRRVLELLGLEGVARLLPEIADGARQQGALTRAAAAATGLTAGTPVVLAPPDTVAAALALGFGGCDAAVGGTIVGPISLHLRAGPDREAARAVPNEATILLFAPAGGWLAVLRQSGTSNVDWLIGAAEQLLLDAGLIGLPRDDLAAMLERRAADAAGGGARYRPFGGEDGGSFVGLSAGTSFYDLLRAVHEGLALAACQAHAALGSRPRQVRIAGAGRLAERCLAACLDAPLFTIGTDAPAAAGAALVAAVALGHYGDVAEASRVWVEPRLRQARTAVPRRGARVPAAGVAPASS